MFRIIRNSALAAACILAASWSSTVHAQTFGDLVGALVKEAVKSTFETPADGTTAQPGAGPKSPLDDPASVSLATLDTSQLSDQVAGALISNGLGEKAADAVGTRCSSYFAVGSVEILDRRVGDTTAKVQAKVTVHPLQNVGAATVIMCYGILTNTGWRAGGSDVMEGPFEFEKWDSGWRLSSVR